MKTNCVLLLLPKKSHLTTLIVRYTHESLAHGGVYSVLSELRKFYWIPQYFSQVKTVLRNCTHCRRFNETTLKLNQSTYRNFRLNPVDIPFANVFIDHMGLFQVKVSKEKTKVWVLVITCLFTRAINLHVCSDLSTDEFLRALQLHTFQYGVPQLVLSDMGSQLVAGGNIVQTFLNDSQSENYFRDNNSKVTTFDQYFKGHSQLGSLVESCVKLSKRLLYGAIKNNVLQYRV